MNKEYQAAEKARLPWMAGVAVGLTAELAGAILLFTGHHRAGLLTALAGLVLWMGCRSLGNRKYTGLCAAQRVKNGLRISDAVPQDPKGLRPEIQAYPLIPRCFPTNHPLLMYPFKGHWQGIDAILTEMTVTYQVEANSRQYLSGSLLKLQTSCSCPGLLAIYGQPYGGLPLSKWEELRPVDTGDRGYLLLAPPDMDVPDYQLDAFAAFGRGRDITAVVWTEADHVNVFLPVQFYSGTWNIFKPMPEAAAGADPLPALTDLSKLLKKLA